MKKYKASCACGTIQLNLNSKALNTFNCHCNTCRTHSGTAFTTYAIFPAKSLEILQGESFISQYNKDGANKYFCHKCGTPLFNDHDKYPDIRMLYLGTLESADTLTPKANVWCENQLDWVNSVKTLKSFDQDYDS